ncbi:shikimate dehydrogenase [Polymorphum gilvum]|uniref:Shikimate dehydrogenase (NADP(+)) n=1 Tax=Polymorphum gilvum (strain LMG 25793 / CGMCC 1.9160 / SL003B-26A1) TaxID=991905 RepID=F2IXI2_POLGS|nr:shikimate dehydrogenase [Polymorphum gilvum]ADZ71605.1 Shikimate 5-dehydrogenase/quinate 5-dehydrogenase family protein [Polymorphum gilvum SL003B-26A1]
MTDGFQPIGTPATILAGLVGRGIRLSRTPAMHEAEGAASGLRYVYRLFDTDSMGPNPPSLQEILRAAELCGFAGLNITFPYKIEVMEFLDGLSDNARAVGAVNTVVFKGGRRMGHNTDLWGFGESFRRSMAGTARRRVLLIGAGGAGLAVAFALLEQGVEHLLVHDRQPERVDALLEAVQARHGAACAEAVGTFHDAVAGGIDGIVNATPVGMAKMPGSPFPLDLLEPTMWVADVVYFPLETELVRAAKAMGCHAMGGAGMAVFQAVRTFELFTGLAADAERVHAAFAALDDPAGA